MLYRSTAFSATNSFTNDILFYVTDIDKEMNFTLHRTVFLSIDKVYLSN